MVRAILGEIYHSAGDSVTQNAAKHKVNRRVRNLLGTHGIQIVGSRIVERNGLQGTEFYVAIPRQTIRESKGIPAELRSRIRGIAVDILD